MIKARGCGKRDYYALNKTAHYQIAQQLLQLKHLYLNPFHKVCYVLKVIQNRRLKCP